MPDNMERAQAQEAFDREIALTNQLARIRAAMSPRDARVDGRCVECDQPIEPKRLAVLSRKTSRCAACAAEHERRHGSARPC